MTGRPLYTLAADLGVLRDRLRDGGDTRGVELLDAIAERLRELAADVDEVLKRLGDPPTD